MGLESLDRPKDDTETARYRTDEGIVYDVEAKIKSQVVPPIPDEEFMHEYEGLEKMEWLEVTLTYNPDETADSYDSIDDALHAGTTVEQDRYEEQIPVFGAPYLPEEEELAGYAERILHQ